MRGQPSSAPAPSAGAHRYSELARTTIRKLIEAVDSDASSGWVFQTRKDNVDVWKKRIQGSPVLMVKGHGKCERPVAVLASPSS